MSIKTIFNTVYKTRNFLISNIVYQRRIRCHKESRDVLDNNKEFKNIHKGERCFILGNGPSLKNEDLDLLKDETIFTVNQINRLPNFKELHSNYHFWVDGNFFQIDLTKPEDIELLNVMSDMGKEESICFFPLERRSFCEKHKLNEKLNLRYFAAKPRLTLHEGFNLPVDFTRYLPGFGTVVQYCICMAIYMGFSEIYLLGCDNTGIMVTLKSAMKKNDEEDYAYAVSNNEKKRMENLFSRHSIEQYAIDYAQTLTAYRILYQYCNKREIKLVNCSSSTVIDSIPRKRLNQIIIGDLKI